MTMLNNVFHVSKLRCIPNEISPSQLSPYYGPSEGYTFWRVFVDDELLSEFAQPFTVYDPVIELFGNLEVPIWGDGRGYISVRQTGQFVIWCRPLEQTVDYFVVDSGLSDSKFIVFELSDYIETLKILKLPTTFLQVNAGRAQRSSHNTTYTPSANPETSLPQLSSGELHWLIRAFLPEDDLPIYRIPESSDDRRGVKLLRRVKAALQKSDESIFAVVSPSSWHNIRIGLDVPEDSECIWYIGTISQGCAILFASNPYFPLWISSSALNDALNAECSSVI